VEEENPLEQAGNAHGILLYSDWSIARSSPARRANQDEADQYRHRFPIRHKRFFDAYVPLTEQQHDTRGLVLLLLWVILHTPEDNSPVVLRSYLMSNLSTVVVVKPS
jgi:hypothetical protein